MAKARATSVADQLANIDRLLAKVPAVAASVAPGAKPKTNAVSRAPTEAQLGKLPIGSAFTYAADLPMGHRQFIRIKPGDDRWIESFGTNLESAVAHWGELAAKPPAESSGYYHSGWDTWYELENNKKTPKQAQ